jgi:hypothetical protein
MKSKRKKTVHQGVEETVLVLRSCKESDGKLVAWHNKANGFEWPRSGVVIAPDWGTKQPNECGGGLHGLLWGVGDAENCCYWGDNAKWLVVEVLKKEVVDIDGTKVKFPRGTVIFCGSLQEAAAIVKKRAPLGTPVTGGSAAAGDRGSAAAGDMGSAAAGYMGSAAAGDMGSAAAGDRGSAAAGDMGSAAAGYMGSAAAGDRGSAAAGYMGSAAAGYRGSAAAGYRGSAAAGDRGSAAAGDRGSAAAGDRGSAAAGYMGRAKGGEAAVISVLYWDEIRQKYWRKCAVVGEDGVLPNTWYEVRDGKLIKADDQSDPVTEGDKNRSEIEKREAERKSAKNK